MPDRLERAHAQHRVVSLRQDVRQQCNGRFGQSLPALPSALLQACGRSHNSGGDVRDESRDEDAGDDEENDPDETTMVTSASNGSQPAHSGDLESRHRADLRQKGEIDVSFFELTSRRRLEYSRDSDHETSKTKFPSTTVTWVDASFQAGLQIETARI
jgi:hypothetical protein